MILVADMFPDPVPYDNNGKERYAPGSDPLEKHIPSVLGDCTNQPTAIPFPATALMAKNVNKVIVCKECEKPCLMYTFKKVNMGELTALKHDLDGLQYVCGSNLKDVKENTKIFVREK